MPAAAESSAIRKLGQLFKLSEVHLWDDSYVTGASETQDWYAAETGCPGSQIAKTRNRAAKQTDEDPSFVEDMELVSLMGSLGLPVSFSTRKEKKNIAIKGKHQGRQAPCEELNTSTVDDARTCENTEELEGAQELMGCMEHTNSGISSMTAVGYNEVYHADADKMLGEDMVYVEKSGFVTACSVEKIPRDEAHNECEPNDNTSNLVESSSPVQENQAAGSVVQLNKVMLGQNSVTNESMMSCTDDCQRGKSSVREDQISWETPSVSHDNDVDCEVCPCPAEPSPVNNHVEKSASDFNYEHGDWKVLWDQFYSQYYFFNIMTQVSTWYPPQGLEDFASYCSTYPSQGLDEPSLQYTSTSVQEHNKSSTKCDKSSGLVCWADNTMDNYISEADRHVVQYEAHMSSCDNGGTTFGKAGVGRHLNHQVHDLYSDAPNLSDVPDEESMCLSAITTIDEAQHDESEQNGSLVTEALEVSQEVTTTKNKKRVRRSQSYRSCQDLADNISTDIAKYWNQRYSLFSLFDSGIKMDEEGWFSVTPEPIAKHHASRVSAGIVIDCFTGVGGNTIQFATKCKHVVAVDIDPQKICCAQHNATVYGVNDHIDFVVGDFIHISPHLKGDTAFMSPPWGGPDYAKVDVYDIKTMLKPCDGYQLFKLATAIASRVVMFLPRNIDLNQLADMCLSVDPPWSVEVEKNFLNGKLKAITAYFEEQDHADASN
ncbi:trimethylguanosine synthase isoform X2 [Brachypodium distachyon]|uniref:trimethylguanosine synthase isoform X2 n=1 Tax=Brachypodium distachyon TaxID=15368 RepID=UPI00052FFC97|nr:trimethylguanosine synthase isoform X2 [Brachypodium distachyon]|eukprot:XP_010228528.1 trimethylguanosine synthase isoform X2 [Brachypodium distachyon]